jgi:hypothetical protein
VSGLSEAARRLVFVVAALGFAAPPALTDVCATPPYEDVRDTALGDLLGRTLPIIARYPSLEAALRETGPAICLFDTASDALGYFEPEANRVMIEADLDPELQRAILFHEIRHVEQFARGLCPDLSLAMGAFARATWALEADATAISLIVAWDLRQDGDPGPWDALASLPRDRDVAAAFAEEMAVSGDLSDAGQAAFDSWYATSDRRDAYYIASCSSYLDTRDRTHALPQYGEIDESFFADLCVLPDGTPFPCEEPAIE